MCRPPLVLAALLGLLAPAALAVQTPQTDTALQKQVDTIAAEHHGKVALFAADLSTGRSVAIDPDLPVQTASTIKLALLWEAIRQVAAGEAHWNETITLKPGDAVGGSGLLHLFDTPLTLTLKDVATMMIVVSDNTATNLMIDRFPTARVNADMAAIGLSQIWLYKKVMKPAAGPMPPDQPRFGLGKTTARQMAMLMERIGRCDLDLPNRPGVDPAKGEAACTAALTMLRNQFYRDEIPRYLETLDSSETGSGIANKSGALNAQRSDVAIVMGKSGPIVLAVYTYENQDQSWTMDNEGQRAIANLAKAIVHAWSPDGIDGTRLAPGLGLHNLPSAAESPSASK